MDVPVTRALKPKYWWLRLLLQRAIWKHVQTIELISFPVVLTRTQDSAIKSMLHHVLANCCRTQSKISYTRRENSPHRHHSYPWLCFCIQVGIPEIWVNKQMSPWDSSTITCISILGGRHFVPNFYVTNWTCDRNFDLNVSLWNIFPFYKLYMRCKFRLMKKFYLTNCTWDRNFDSNVSLWNSSLCYKLYMPLKFQSQCKLVAGLVTQSIAVLEAVPLNHSIQNCDPSFRVNNVNDGGCRVTSFLDLPS